MQEPNLTSVTATEFLAHHADMNVEQLAVLVVLKLVGKPEDVNVTVTRGRQFTIMEFDVNPDDVGRLVGIRGHTIRAIRSIIGAAAGGSQMKYNIQVVEPDGSSRSRNGQRDHHARR